MVLLANRVSASRCPAIRASTSETPNDFAARWTSSNSLRHSSNDKMGAGLSAISRSNLDVVEARRAGTVARADHLLGLALSAVRYAPQCPMIAIGDSHAGIPKFRRDAAVCRILEHPLPLAIADFPGDLTSELEVVALVIDRPAPVRLHSDRVAHSAKYFLQRLFPGQQAHIRHADERL